MKLYYIDESMFQKTHFSSQVLYRFERILMRNPGSLVLISVTGDHNEDIEMFISSQKLNTVMLSPALFDFEGIRGNLHTTFLSVDMFPVMESYSGSLVEYDMDTNSVKRIYLDLFIEFEYNDMDFIIKEMEDVLQAKFEFMKKK